MKEHTDKNIKNVSYSKMCSYFRMVEHANDGRHLCGYIVFCEDSYDIPYSEEARTYAVSSNNKAFQSNMGGYSIYGSSLDGTDVCVRLERYMVSEKGGKDGWKIERCYFKKDDLEKVKDLIKEKSPRER